MDAGGQGGLAAGFAGAGWRDVRQKHRRASGGLTARSSGPPGARRGWAVQESSMPWGSNIRK